MEVKGAHLPAAGKGMMPGNVVEAQRMKPSWKSYPLWVYGFAVILVIVIGSITGIVLSATVEKEAVGQSTVPTFAPTLVLPNTSNLNSSDGGDITTCGVLCRQLACNQQPMDECLFPCVWRENVQVDESLLGYCSYTNVFVESINIRETGDQNGVGKYVFQVVDPMNQSNSTKDAVLSIAANLGLERFEIHYEGIGTETSFSFFLDLPENILRNETNFSAYGYFNNSRLEISRDCKGDDKYLEYKGYSTRNMSFRFNDSIQISALEESSEGVSVCVVQKPETYCSSMDRGMLS